VSESGGQVLLREGTTTTIKGEKVEVSIVTEIKGKKKGISAARFNHPPSYSILHAQIPASFLLWP
jgi:hydroxyethylthiazole kinase-like sugar kinase family protein